MDASVVPESATFGGESALFGGEAAVFGCDAAIFGGEGDKNGGRQVARARALVEMTIEEEDGHINVQSHAQNFHKSTSSPRKYMERIQEFVELVLWTKRRYPRLVFVTVSELMQLKGRSAALFMKAVVLFMEAEMLFMVAVAVFMDALLPSMAAILEVMAAILLSLAMKCPDVTRSGCADAVCPVSVGGILVCECGVPVCLCCVSGVPMRYVRCSYSACAACATRCPVRIPRMSYAGATQCPVLICMLLLGAGWSKEIWVASPIVLRLCYAMPGTDMIYALLPPYARAMRCPKQTLRMLRYLPMSVLCDVRY
eukprot:1098955-Rhodomonas_salina.3